MKKLEVFKSIYFFSYLFFKWNDNQTESCGFGIHQYKNIEISLSLTSYLCEDFKNKKRNLEERTSAAAKKTYAHVDEEKGK